MRTPGELLPLMGRSGIAWILHRPFHTFLCHFFWRFNSTPVVCHFLCQNSILFPLSPGLCTVHYCFLFYIINFPLLWVRPAEHALKVAGDATELLPFSSHPSQYRDGFKHKRTIPLSKRFTSEKGCCLNPLLLFFCFNQLPNMRSFWIWHLHTLLMKWEFSMAENMVFHLPLTWEQFYIYL